MSVKTRIESDFIGEKEIPDGAYYGVQTVRALENFPITGLKINNDLIRALAMVKKAAAIANFEIGELEEEKKDAIVKASEEIIEGELHDQFIVDPIQGGAGTSINMNGNEVIANRALEILGREKGDYEFISPNNHVNMAQSTNDSVPTAIHIAVIMRAEKLLEVMRDMQAAFSQKAEEFDDVIKMGRTHLQDAVPIRLGQEFGAYARVIGRDIARIELSLEHLKEINIGATAVGTGLNAQPEYIEHVVKILSEISGYELVSAENLVDATQFTDGYVEVSANLKIAMVNMSKIANDIRMMASGPKAGLAEIVLPARQPGSSIMPGKVNPVMPEMINQVAFQVQGNDLTVTLASEAGQFELNVMGPVLQYNLLQSIDIMTNAFRSFTDFCLVGIEANRDVMQAYVDRSLGVITALVPHIGYKASSEIVKEAMKTGKGVRELILEKGILSENQINHVLNAFEMTNIGISELPQE